MSQMDYPKYEIPDRPELRRVVVDWPNFREDISSAITDGSSYPVDYYTDNDPRLPLCDYCKGHTWGADNTCQHCGAPL